VDIGEKFNRQSRLWLWTDIASQLLSTAYSAN